MQTTTMSRKGQVVLPAAVRAQAGLRPGDRFMVELRGSEIVFSPLPRDPLLALQGAFAGEDSLTEALLAERHRERERARG